MWLGQVQKALASANFKEILIVQERKTLQSLCPKSYPPWLQDLGGEGEDTIRLERIDRALGGPMGFPLRTGYPPQS